jgi:hypothetical protein
MNEPDKQIFKSIVGNPLKINLNINIDNKPTNVVLTSAILYYPPPKENPKENPKKGQKGGRTEYDSENQNRNQKPNQGTQYPLLPPVGIDYPIKKLIELDFREMVKVLFDPDRFTKKMTKWVADTEKESALLQPPPPNEEEISKLYSEENEKKINWEKKNVQMLLHLLFPTYYFGSLEYKTSMHYWNPNETFHTFPVTRTFSYLKYNGKVYTITNCVWLNDILNSPSYKPYVDGFRSYYLWTLHIKNVIKKRIIQENRKRTKFEKENDTENTEETPKPENPMIAFIENNIQNLKGLSEKITETENSIELSIVKLRPVFRKNNLINLTQNATNYLESFTKMPVMSDKNSVLNEFFDVINEYVYDTQEEEVPETDPNKEIPEVTNHRLLYKLLKNIFLFKSHKKNLSQLLNRLPHIQNNYDIYFYTGLNTKRSEDYYRQNLFTDVVLDVVDGLVDDSNKSMVKCYYYDHWIGKMMNFFNGTYWDVAKDRVYVNLLNVQNKVEDAEDELGNSNPESPGYGDGNGDSGYGNIGYGNSGYDNGYGNSGYGNDNGYGNSYDTMMPTSQPKRSSQATKKITPELIQFFNDNVLSITGLESDKNFKQTMEKISKLNELVLNTQSADLFKNIASHTWTKSLQKEFKIQNNDTLINMLKMEDFLLEMTEKISSFIKNNRLQTLTTQYNKFINVIKREIAIIDIDINSLINFLPIDAKYKDILYDDKNNYLNNQTKKVNYYFYIFLFLYKKIFEFVIKFLENKINEENKNKGGGKTQKYSHAHSANHKTHKNHK